MRHHLDGREGRVQEWMLWEHLNAMRNTIAVDPVERLADIELPNQRDRRIW